MSRWQPDAANMERLRAKYPPLNPEPQRVHDGDPEREDDSWIKVRVPKAVAVALARERYRRGTKTGEFDYDMPWENARSDDSQRAHMRCRVRRAACPRCPVWVDGGAR